MVEMLKKNPVVAVEVVLARLHQKIEEWQSDKRKMTDIWQKMYDANYHKSLDHRSFYFKQVSSLTCTLATCRAVQSAREPPKGVSYCTPNVLLCLLTVDPCLDSQWMELSYFWLPGLTPPLSCVFADRQAEPGPEDHDAGDQGHCGQAAAGGHRHPPCVHQLLRQAHPRPHLQLQGKVRTPSSA